MDSMDIVFWIALFMAWFLGLLMGYGLWDFIHSEAEVPAPPEAKAENDVQDIHQQVDRILEKLERRKK